MFRLLVLCCSLLAVPTFGQVASAPDEPLVPPGVPPDERIDVTGDGIPDLVITGRTDHIPDPELGLEGWYRRFVRTLPGTAVLRHGTPNNYGFYILAEGAAIDTAALAKGFHFKQLEWASSELIEFHVLEQPFGPGLDPRAKGWYGSGEEYEGSFVLRSTMGGRTAIAAFQIWFNLPAGRIWITPKGSLSVAAHFGEPVAAQEPDPSKEPPRVRFYGSGLEEQPPQTVIPPGIPPDERIDLSSDDIADVVLTGYVAHNENPKNSGWYRRGLSPLPGTSLLMEKQADGTYGWFQLKMGDALTPEQLAMKLQSGWFRWADPAKEPVLVLALEQRFGFGGTLGAEVGWYRPEPFITYMLVYRTTQYGRPMIGCFELGGATPGGELWINEQRLVNEGEVLKVE